jgi:hypothetical protein
MLRSALARGRRGPGARSQPQAIASYDGDDHRLYGLRILSAWQELDILGCDTIQGYYLARPSPPDVIAHLVNASISGSRGAGASDLDPRYGAAHVGQSRGTRDTRVPHNPAGARS